MLCVGLPGDIPGGRTELLHHLVHPRQNTGVPGRVEFLDGDFGNRLERLGHFGDIGHGLVQAAGNGDRVRLVGPGAKRRFRRGHHQLALPHQPHRHAGLAVGVDLHVGDLDLGHVQQAPALARADRDDLADRAVADLERVALLKAQAARGFLRMKRRALVTLLEQVRRTSQQTIPTRTASVRRTKRPAMSSLCFFWGIFGLHLVPSTKSQAPSIK